MQIPVTDAFGSQDAIVGDLRLPSAPRGLIAFAHGSGSSRHSPRNRLVADVLHQAGFGSLLLDLLTLDEERTDIRTRGLRFDIRLLADRLLSAMDELEHLPETALPLGL